MQDIKYGKYISPHLIRYNERISINNKEITDEEMSDILEKIAEKVEVYNSEHEIKVKEFEVITTLALIYFAQNNTDFVVLETGLGGRYDSTNIADGMISIITDIGLDHMDILGDKIEEIAKAKAGIIKENCITIMLSKQKNIESIIKDECKKKNNILYLINKNDIKNYSFDKNFQKIDYKNYKNICINLKGKCQTENASLTLECIDILKEKGYDIKEEAVRKRS